MRRSFSGSQGTEIPLPLDNLHHLCDHRKVMKVTLTAKLKLHPDAAQFQALRATQFAYRDGLNYVSRYAYAHGKMSNKVRLQDGTYEELRARFKIPARMA
jgi:putative transposase